MIRILVLTAALLPFAGCLSVTTERHTTIGQEMIDLDKARASGAISEADYAMLKEALLKGDLHRPVRNSLP